MPHHLGSKNPRAKLHERDIPKIRDMFKQGLSDREIADIFHVSYTTIWGIRVGYHWVHVP